MLSGLFGGRISGEKFILAVKNNDLATVQNYIAENTGNAMAINRPQTISPYYPLIAAVQQGHVEIVRALLAVPGIDLNVSDMDSNTVLISAASLGHIEIVRALLAAPHLNLVLRNKRGYTAAQEATRQNNHAIERLITFEIQARALRKAAVNGQLDVVQKFINEHPNNIALFNARDRNGLTALSRAASSGQVAVVHALLAVRGIDVNIPDLVGLTALSRAAFNGHANCVIALLTKSGIDVNVNVVDIDGNTALIHAAARGHTNIVQALLADTGINLAIQNHLHLTAARVAVQNRHTEIVQLIERAEATPPVSRFLVADQEGAFQRALDSANQTEAPTVPIAQSPVPPTPPPATISADQILNAAESDDLDDVRTYIAAHREAVSHVNQYTARMIEDEITRRSTASPSDPTVDIPPGVPTLPPTTISTEQFLHAARDGNLATVQAYIAAPRDDRDDPAAMNVTDESGNSALHLAAMNGNTNVITALGAVSAVDVNHPHSGDAFTPLMRAVALGVPGSVIALLAIPRVEVNARNEIGNTALIISVLTGNQVVTGLLLRAPRVNLNIRNNDGRTALQIARSWNNSNIVRMIEAEIASRAAASLSDAPIAPPVSAPNPPSATTISAGQFLAAAVNGDLATIQAYIAAHRHDPVAMNVTDEIRNSALHLAAMNGHTTVVTALANVSTLNVNQPDIRGYTPLMMAVWCQHPDSVTTLLEFPRIEVNARSEAGNTALHHSAYRGREASLALLLADSRVNLTLENNDGQTAAQRARDADRPNIARMIEAEIARRAAASLSDAPIAYNPSPATNSFEQFLNAARDGDLLTVRRYITANRNSLASAMNVVDVRTGNTALIAAASAGRGNIVNELLNTQGVNIELQNRQGLTAAQAAQQNGREQIAVRLMQLISARAAPVPTPVEAAAPKTPSSPAIHLNFEQQLEAISYAGLIPDHLKCPISQFIMNDPIAVSSGQIYDRANLKRWAAGRSTFPCPVTRLIIQSSELENKTCISIRTLIEKFVNKKVKAAERLKEEAEKQVAAQPQQATAVAAPQEPTPSPGPRLFNPSQNNPSSASGIPSQKDKPPEEPRTPPSSP